MNLSLPAWVYSNAEFFSLEKEYIFRNTPNWFVMKVIFQNPVTMRHLHSLTAISLLLGRLLARFVRSSMSAVIVLIDC